MKTKRRKCNLLLNVDIIYEFTGYVEGDSDENEDKVGQYISTKLSFSKDDTLLGR